MRVRGKRVGELAADDLNTLVSARVPESLELEYKLELPGPGDGERKEYLADVSAFANTAGGVLLYGIETERDQRDRDTGIPKRIVGVKVPNADELVRRLTSIARDSLDPRLVPEIVLQIVDVDDLRQVVAIGVPRSLAGPHAVWFNKSGKFHRRSSAAKYQADVRDIRRMFLEAESWEDGARAFRDDRLKIISSDPHGLNLREDARLFVHAVPLGRREAAVDVRPHVVTIQSWADNAIELGTQIRGAFNFEGYMISGRDSGNRMAAYAQFFRNGALEGCTHRFHDVAQGSGGLIRVFDLSAFTTWLPTLAQTSTELLSRNLGVDPPFALYATAADMLGRTTGHFGRRQSGVFDRDTIALPMIFIPDASVDFVGACESALLVLWQSANLRDIVR